jgi:hypothetical protein
MNRVLAVAGTALLVAVAVGGCVSTDDRVVTFPPVSFGTGATTAATAETRRLVEAALAAEGLQAVEPSAGHRPAESPTLTDAPRLVLQVQLPDDLTHGYVTIYELKDVVAADAAAREQAAYVGSGIGRIQFPPDTGFVIRTAGATVVFFAWSPGNSPDERTPRIAAALETIGSAIEVPR